LCLDEPTVITIEIVSSARLLAKFDWALGHVQEIWFYSEKHYEKPSFHDRHPFAKLDASGLQWVANRATTSGIQDREATNG